MRWPLCGLSQRAWTDFEAAEFGDAEQQPQQEQRYSLLLTPVHMPCLLLAACKLLLLLLCGAPVDGVPYPMLHGQDIGPLWGQCYQCPCYLSTSRAGLHV